MFKKKDYNDREELYFVLKSLKKKMWILKNLCLQSTPWTMFSLMKSLCYYCPTILPSFQHFGPLPLPLVFICCVAFYLYALSSVFFTTTMFSVRRPSQPHTIRTGDVIPLCSRLQTITPSPPVIHLHNCRSSSTCTTAAPCAAAILVDNNQWWTKYLRQLKV